MFDFTTASREDIRHVYNAIAREIGDDRFFTTKELDVLPKVLAQCEQVLCFSSGYMGGNSWLIVLTDQRVLFVDKGMIFGLQQTSIELESIVAIDGKTGLMFGEMTISTAAGPNKIENVWKRTVNTFVNKVRAAMAARRQGEQLVSPGSDTIPTPAAPTPGPAPQPVQAPVPTSAPTFTPPAAPADVPTPAPAVPAAPADLGARVARLDRLLAAGSIDRATYDRDRRALGA